MFRSRRLDRLIAYTVTGWIIMLLFLWMGAHAAQPTGLHVGEQSEPSVIVCNREALMFTIDLLQQRALGQELRAVVPCDDDGQYRVNLERLERTSLERARLTRRGAPSAAAPGSSLGACSSDKECEAETEKMCKDAGHDGVKDETVQVVRHVDGTSTCSGDCKKNGAVAFVTCNATTSWPPAYSRWPLRRR